MWDLDIFPLLAGLTVFVEALMGSNIITNLSPLSGDSKKSTLQYIFQLLFQDQKYHVGVID